VNDDFLSLIRGDKRGPWAGVQRGALWLASLLYGAAVRLRNFCYDRGWKRSHAAGAPVISVGNLTVGGTGKTPCVEYVARWCREHDRRVAILSRGYGAQTGANDEALLLEENLPDVPHLQDADRVQLAQIAVEELESEVLVLDDGFQHRRLRRTLDIVLIDATCPWGYGHLLPRGLLREPVSGLRRAGLVLLTRSDQVAADTLDRVQTSVQKIAPHTAVVHSVHRPVELINADGESAELDILRDREVAAFCGLGNPHPFRRTLEVLGARVASFRTFPDHHPYTREDIDDLRRWARQQATDCLVITTQKDLVKVRLSRLGERPLWALRIRLHITAEQELLDRKLKEALA
jgi:tetraacyldisaccharide 4'-kinase